MARRAKMTGFARFLIIMVFVAPLAYLGASYYNGEDGVQNLKNLLGIDKAQTESVDRTDRNDDSSTFSGDTQALQQQIRDLQSENDELKKSLRERDREIQELRSKLNE